MLITAFGEISHRKKYNISEITVISDKITKYETYEFLKIRFV
jgi:hypothetical protein